MGFKMITAPYLHYEYICSQVESFSEVCSVCGDEFVNNEDLLHHISVMHPGQEVPSTSMSDVPCGSQQNNNAPGTSISKYSQNYDGWKIEHYQERMFL